jgi:Protein of unknown function (DUF3078).
MIGLRKALVGIFLGLVLSAIPAGAVGNSLLSGTDTDSLSVSLPENIDIRSRLVKPEINLVYPDTVVFFECMFLPIVFEGKAVDDVDFMIYPRLKTSPVPPDENGPKLFSDKKGIGVFQRKLYYDIIFNHIDNVNYTYKDFPEELEKTEEIEPNLLQLLFSVEYDPSNATDINKLERFVPKRKYWFLTGNNKIQFSQNHISDTWYKGGTDNLNLLSVQNLYLKYKKNKIQFNSSFEWKLNLFNYIVEEKIEETDKKKNVNEYRIGEELFRMYADFNVHAIRNWSYSTNLEIKTQFLLNKPNDEILSSFLSPLYVNIGVLGMKFNKEKILSPKAGKKYSINADISPFSVQYVYVLSDSVDIKRFGIDDGHKHRVNLGSTVNAKFIMNFNKNTRFTCRFKYFTNYKDNNVFELENDLNMPLNRYFSTTLYLYLRYDDFATPRPEGGSKWGDFQLNELLSFGFNYTW